MRTQRAARGSIDSRTAHADVASGSLRLFVYHCRSSITRLFPVGRPARTRPIRYLGLRTTGLKCYTCVCASSAHVCVMHSRGLSASYPRPEHASGGGRGRRFRHGTRCCARWTLMGPSTGTCNVCQLDKVFTLGSSISAHYGASYYLRRWTLGGGPCGTGTCVSI